MAKKYKLAAVVEAIESARGMVHLAAKTLRCSPQTIYNYARESKQVRDVISDQRNLIKDVAELQLVNAIQRGEAWAICFYLKTQGRDRGYVEGHEYTVAGAPGNRDDQGNLMKKLEQLAGKENAD